MCFNILFLIILYTLAENFNIPPAMKDIVVAIDFSKGSVHALEYAIELANLIHVNVNMVWVDTVSGNDVGFPGDSKEFRIEAKNNLDELLATYKDKLLHGKLIAKVRKGVFIRSLQLL